jgi:hypothetical protein
VIQFHVRPFVLLEINKKAAAAQLVSLRRQPWEAETLEPAWLFALKRKDYLPIILHADDCPAIPLRLGHAVPA